MCPPYYRGGKAGVAIGIGCKKGCAAEAIIALVKRALVAASCTAAEARLFTHAAKQNEAGLAEAAKELGLPLFFLDLQLLQQAALRTSIRSPKVMELFGVPSIAETAALAGAGPTSVLLVARMSEGGASCAIAGKSGP